MTMTLTTKNMFFTLEFNNMAEACEFLRMFLDENQNTIVSTVLDGQNTILSTSMGEKHDYQML